MEFLYKTKKIFLIMPGGYAALHKIIIHGYILDAGKGFLILFMHDRLSYGFS
jgi:hypothetical protein